MIDSVTGKAASVDFRPLSLEGVMRSIRRDRPFLLGYLMERLIETAVEVTKKSAEPFEPVDRRVPLEPTRLKLAPHVEKPKTWLPRWMRRRDENGEDDAQTLVEYAVILALVAVVAIVALLFMGQALSETLSRVGDSLP